ncbi:MAG: hypothetical protein KC414_14215, partial [Romboutsia sp.]|nr:hypothetical protein [Romboutsia sp.]
MALTKTWEVSTLEACLRESKNECFTNQGLLKNQLKKIVLDTESKGKTPDRTLSRTLQSLRDCGLITFVKRGVYKLTGETFDVNKEDKKSSK